MDSYYILPLKYRELFLKLGKKHGISQQARESNEGYYNLLVKNGYNPITIEENQVHFNGTDVKMPLKNKRINYIKRHAHEPKVKLINGKYILTPSSIADIFWGYTSLKLSDKILSDTINYYLN